MRVCLRQLHIFHIPFVKTLLRNVNTFSFPMNIFSFSLILIKRAQVVEQDKSFPSQLRVMNFSDGSPYETLHSYVSNAVGPFFKSYIKETGKAER